MDRTSVIEELKVNNIEFKRMYDKHKGFERQLEELQNRFHLSSEEETKAKKIKKNKLLLKDKMEIFITNYAGSD